MQIAGVLLGDKVTNIFLAELAVRILHTQFRGEILLSRFVSLVARLELNGGTRCEVGDQQPERPDLLWQLTQLRASSSFLFFFAIAREVLRFRECREFLQMVEFF